MPMIKEKHILHISNGCQSNKRTLFADISLAFNCKNPVLTKLTSMKAYIYGSHPLAPQPFRSRLLLQQKEDSHHGSETQSWL